MGYWNKYWIDILHLQAVQRKKEHIKSNNSFQIDNYRYADLEREWSGIRRGKDHPLYGKSRSDEVKRKISEAHKGKKHSLETKNKIAKGRLGKKHSEKTKAKMKEFRLKEGIGGHRGGLHHQNLVNKIASQWDNGLNKVEIEKWLKLPNHHWRIIDVLINDKNCIEVGTCTRNKIEELEKYGFKVIHLPYSNFEESLLEVN